MAVHVGSPTSIKINDVAVGRTTGDLSITRNATYVEIRRPDSPHAIGVRKRSLFYEVGFSLTDYSMANLARAFDVPYVAGPPPSITLNDPAVQEVKLEIAAGGVSITFLRAVQVGTGGINFGGSTLTALPLNFRAFLATASSTLATIGGVTMPAQFHYTVERPKRQSAIPTYGGVQRFAAPTILDALIAFRAEHCTRAQKNNIVGVYLDNVANTVSFTGIHGGIATVWFETLDPPVEEDDLWNLSGALRIESETAMEEEEFET